MSHPYRKRVETIDALQYNGINNVEMLEFAPGYLEIIESTLMQKGHPVPIANNEWVYQNTATKVFSRMSEEQFPLMWQPGGAAP